MSFVDTIMEKTKELASTEGRKREQSEPVDQPWEAAFREKRNLTKEEALAWVHQFTPEQVKRMIPLFDALATISKETEVPQP